MHYSHLLSHDLHDSVGCHLGSNNNSPSDTGDPKQREQSQVPSLSPSHAHPLGDVDDDNDNPFDLDAGDPKL